MIRRSPSPRTITNPPVTPIQIAAAGLTTAQGAVIETRPASAPFMVKNRSGFPNRIQEMKVVVTAAAAAARFVLMAMSEMASPSPTARLEPGLKPNQPNQRMNTPSEASGTEWPGMGFELPSALKRPRRGPRIMAPTSAVAPPVRWTTVEPAKSKKSSWASQPPPHVQWPTTG